MNRIETLIQQVNSRIRGNNGLYISNNKDIALLRLGYNEAEGKPDILRRANGLSLYFNECDIKIHPNELLVGYINQGKSIMHPLKEDNAISGHFSVDYELMLGLGIDGTFDRINEFKKKNCESLVNNDDIKDKIDFYDACIIVLKGFQDYILRYKQVADEEIQYSTNESQRKYDLIRISECLDNIAHNPPQNIYEAIQMMLLYHMVIQFEVGCCSFGRPDRFLYPYYLKSLELGMNEELIDEIISAWFIKTTEFMHIPQGMLIGGQMEDGSSACNELTMKFIKIMGKIKTLNPAMGFSWNKQSPPEYMQEIMKNYSNNCVHPALFNDDTIIRGLKRMGIEHNHAVNYVNCTCTEITPVGYSNIFVVANYINLNSSLLEAVFDDVEYSSFSEFCEGFFRFFRADIKRIITNEIKQQKIRRNTFSQPLVSIFMHDCLETGIDMSNGGARYNYGYPQLVGLPTATDSLYVIKKLVYEQKTLTLEELSDILAENWEGQEKLRAEILNKFPKWGNDIDEIDRLGLNIVDVYYDEVEKYEGIFKNGRFYPGFLCWTTHERFGSILWATPDGRLAHTPVSNSIAPVAGKGKSGITSILNSAAKIDQVRGCGSSVLNLSILQSNLKNEYQFGKFIDLFETYFKNGGFQIQVNVTNKEILMDAQKHPENYTDLIVKVGGYADYFVNLNKNLQDEIIERNYTS